MVNRRRNQAKASFVPWRRLWAPFYSSPVCDPHVWFVVQVKASHLFHSPTWHPLLFFKRSSSPQGSAFSPTPPLHNERESMVAEEELIAQPCSVYWGGVEIGKHLSKSGPPGIQQASLSHFCACQPYDRRNTGGEWSRQELKRNRRSVSLQVKHAGKLKHSQYEPRKLVDAFQKSCWTWGQVQLMAFWKSSLTKTLALRWF